MTLKDDLVRFHFHVRVHPQVTPVTRSMCSRLLKLKKKYFLLHAKVIKSFKKCISRVKKQPLRQ